MRTSALETETHGYPPHEGRVVTSEDWSAQLRAQGRRVTRQHLAVLAAVQDHPHSSAEQIAPDATAKFAEYMASVT